MGDQPPVPPAQPAAPGGAPTGPQGQPLAEWWKRLVALIIDGFIVGIPSGILGPIIFGFMFAGFTPEATFDPVTGQIDTSGGFFAGILAAQGALFLAGAVISAVYYTFLHAKRGQTVGKMALRLKVVDETTGELIPTGKAFVRWIIPGLGWLTCGILTLIDGLFPLWDPKRQALHDKMAKTSVIQL
jgi:uncharacterized RDD family membrane protein YckC